MRSRKTSSRVGVRKVRSRTTTSPPAEHNFERVPPVRSRRPLWDLAHPENPDPPISGVVRQDSPYLEKNFTGMAWSALKTASVSGAAYSENDESVTPTLTVLDIKTSQST